MTKRRKTPKKTEEVLAILKQCAREKRTITYGEIADATGLIARGVPAPLRCIEEQVCRPYRRPWLSALVVNNKTKRPGPAFAPEGVSVDLDRDQWWRELVEQVYAYDWSDVELES